LFVFVVKILLFINLRVNGPVDSSARIDHKQALQESFIQICCAYAERHAIVVEQGQTIGRFLEKMNEQLAHGRGAKHVTVGETWNDVKVSRQKPDFL
jgi:hypothetical protein